MSTKIEWTDETWNPIRARDLETGKVGWHCERVSPGCANCYAALLNGRKLPGKGGTGHDYARDKRERVEIFVDEDTLVQPLRWRKPRKVFVCSMTDLFGEFVSDAMIDRVFAVMALTPHITYQVLTKRAKRMRKWAALSAIGVEDMRRAHVSAAACSLLESMGEMPNGRPTERWFDWAPWLDLSSSYGLRWPLPNVWLGVSAEDQKTGDERIPELLATPAAVRFVSYEPALGPVDLDSRLGGTRWIGGQRGCGQRDGNREHHHDERCRPGLDWIIAGGESGPGARPAHPDWFRSVRAQCERAGVAYFHKQLCDGGKKIPLGDWPEDLKVRGFPRAL